MSQSALAALALNTAAVETKPAPITGPIRFNVPLADNDEFSLLKPKWRHQITLTLRILERVHELRNGGDFVRATDQLAVSYSHLNGFSGVSLRRKYAAYIESGCKWRSLVKGYKAPSKQPKEFIEFLKGLIEQNGRSVAAAIAKLRDEIWPSGAEIPGYGSWMTFFRATHPQLDVPERFPAIWPQGWHPDNLRKYGPSRAERKIFGEGIASAHGNLPVIRRDPSKLRPMEWIVIDDFQLDVMCVFAGDPERGLKAQTAYVGGLLAMCVGTRKKLARLFGPMVDREEKQKDGTVKTVRSSVRAIDVQALLYTIFRDHGLPDYDVTIICENRSASIAPELELMLSTVYEGRIKVRRTSLIDHKTLPNGFVEGGGTPWEKGWIESEFNYLWNLLAPTKGYKGSNERLNGPADLPDKLKYAAKFLSAGDKASDLNLPPEIVDELHLPFLNEAQLAQAFDFVLERSERRTKHRMLGFDTVTEFRWGNPKLPAPAGIDPVGPNSFRALGALTRQEQLQMVPEERKESPLERWERLSAANPRSGLKEHALALFLLTPNRATWRNHAVTFSRKGLGGFSYVDDDNLMAEVPERTDVLAYVDFNAPASAYVTHLDGRPIGVLRMLGDSTRGVDITDDDAMAKARARRAEIVNRVLAQVRARPLHKAADEQLAADRAHNDAVVATYREATALVPAAERLAAARGEVAAAEAKKKADAKAVQRTVKRAAANLSDEDEAAMRGAPAPAATPADDTEGMSLSDLT